MLKLYCRAYFDVERLTADIEDEGEVITNAKGTPMMNPKVQARNFAEARFITLSARLKLQPASRGDASRGESKQTKRKNAANDAAQNVLDDEEELLAGGATLPATGFETLQ